MHISKQTFVIIFVSIGILLISAISLFVVVMYHKPKSNDSINTLTLFGDSNCPKNITKKLPPLCLQADSDGEYFRNGMCQQDFVNYCTEEDPKREFCDLKGTFTIDGKTPCCTMCEEYKNYIS